MNCRLGGTYARPIGKCRRADLFLGLCDMFLSDPGPLIKQLILSKFTFASFLALKGPRSLLAVQIIPIQKFSDRQWSPS